MVSSVLPFSLKPKIAFSLKSCVFMNFLHRFKIMPWSTYCCVKFFLQICQGLGKSTNFPQLSTI